MFFFVLFRTPPNHQLNDDGFFFLITLKHLPHLSFTRIPDDDIAPRIIDGHFRKPRVFGKWKYAAIDSLRI